jgi:integrase
METVSPIRDKRQIEAMKKALGSPRDKLLFIFGINSGLRISDILKLKVGDVRGQDAIYLVTDEDGKKKVFREQKTGKAKQVRLNKSIKDAIKTLVPKDASDNDYLIPSQKGGAIDRTQAHRILDAAAKRAGITESVSCHSLRKTFGYHAYQGGTDLALLQSIFNHASQRVTLRYIGIEQDDINDVYDTLNL